MQTPHRHQRRDRDGSRQNAVGPQGKEQNAHSLTSVGIATVDSKMPQGKEKNAHSLASVGIGTVDTKSLHNAPGQGEECAISRLCGDHDG